jgi:hypothetical protein
MSAIAVGTDSPAGVQLAHRVVNRLGDEIAADLIVALEPARRRVYDCECALRIRPVSTCGSPQQGTACTKRL